MPWLNQFFTAFRDHFSTIVYKRHVGWLSVTIKIHPTVSTGHQSLKHRPNRILSTVTARHQSFKMKQQQFTSGSLVWRVITGQEAGPSVRLDMIISAFTQWVGKCWLLMDWGVEKKQWVPSFSGLYFMKGQLCSINAQPFSQIGIFLYLRG